MRIEAGLDSGAVMAQERVPIGSGTTAGELQQTLAHAGARLLVAGLAALEEGRCEWHAQAADGITRAPKFDRQAAQIDWRQPALQIDRLVRAFNPRPVAYTLWSGQPLRIWRAHVASAEQTERARAGLPAGVSALPGTVLAVAENALLVLCAEQQALAIEQVQLPGRRPISTREFAPGRVTAGVRFET
jgi:methionyl-tRNA formyltransferase